MAELQEPKYKKGDSVRFTRGQYYSNSSGEGVIIAVGHDHYEIEVKVVDSPHETVRAGSHINRDSKYITDISRAIEDGNISYA